MAHREAGKERLASFVRVVLLLLFSLAAAGPACKERSVGAGGDSGLPDAAAPDGSPPPDGAQPCQAERLEMGFVVATEVEPSHPEPSLDDFFLEGDAAYHGPITEPLSTSPAFRWEVQLDHGGGARSTLQYHLPEGLGLPVEEGRPYQLLYRRRHGFEGVSAGLVVTRPTSGLPPLLFVGDAGPFERAFDPEELAMSPLKVFVEDLPGCPPTVDPDCGGDRFLDQLRFDSSTGGAITAVTLSQGGVASLPVFGEPFRVINLASSHADPPCLDFNPWDIAYLAVSEAALPILCDPAIFRIWDEEIPFEVGSFCDEIVLCASSAQAAAALGVAPGLECAPGGPPCGLGEELCSWSPEEPIDQALYDEICQVSLLPEPPAFIECRVYL